MLELFAKNPLLTFFTVIALGHLLGRIKIAGFSLGVAAVLFVGLGFGALVPNTQLPEIIYQLGLVLFVYTLGIANGSSFFQSFKKQGLRDNLLVLGLLGFGVLLTYGIARGLGLSGPLAAGLFAGSLTNTPALAGVVEAMGQSVDKNLPVVAYSVAYPMGVIAMLLSINILERLWKIDYAKETQNSGQQPEEIVRQEVQIAHPVRIAELAQSKGWRVVLGRFLHSENLQLVAPDTVLQTGDILSVIGSPLELAKVQHDLGQTVNSSHSSLEQDRSQLDFRRMVVSSAKVVGKPLSDLALPQKYGALITRVGRIDADFLPDKNTRLELGDRVRVVAAPEKLGEVAQFLGDSQATVAEFNALSLGLGISLGLLLGSIEIPLWGGAHFKLGLAGGPLLVGLVLGWLEVSGKIVWKIPHAANLSLRELGLLLFLGGVGTRAGQAFGNTVATPLGLSLFLAGTVITSSVAVLTLWLGYKWLKIPFPMLTGVLAGLQTQPAVLGFARERAKNELPGRGYLEVYPLAMLLKIILAQVLLQVLS